jgi:hypothetical protein
MTIVCPVCFEFHSNWRIGSAWLMPIADCLADYCKQAGASPHVSHRNFLAAFQFTPGLVTIQSNSDPYQGIGPTVRQYGALSEA